MWTQAFAVIVNSRKIESLSVPLTFSLHAFSILVSCLLSFSSIETQAYFNNFLRSSLKYPQYLKLRLFRPKVHLPDVVCPEIKSIRSDDIHTLQHGEQN